MFFNPIGGTTSPLAFSVPFFFATSLLPFKLATFTGNFSDSF